MTFLYSRNTQEKKLLLNAKIRFHICDLRWFRLLGGEFSIYVREKIGVDRWNFYILLFCCLRYWIFQFLMATKSTSLRGKNHFLKYMTAKHAGRKKIIFKIEMRSRGGNFLFYLQTFIVLINFYRKNLLKN